MDNLADNLHFNLNYSDFTQQTPLHVIHHHQQDPSFQDLPTSYSTFSLLPSTVPPQLHQPTVNVNKETNNKQQPRLLPATSALSHNQHEEQQSQQQNQQSVMTPPPSTTATATTTTTAASLNLFSPSSPGSCSSRKTTPSRTRVTRPPNAFLLFNKEMRKRLKIDNPTWTVSDISKEIGDRWRTLNQEQKHQYVIHANKIKESQQVLHPNAMYIRRSKAELTEAGHYEKVEKKRADGREQQIFSQVMAATTTTIATSESPSLSSSSSATTTMETTTAASSSLNRTAPSVSTSSPALSSSSSSSSTAAAAAAASASSASSSTLINATVMGTTTPLTGMMDPSGFFVGTESSNNSGQTYMVTHDHTQATARPTTKRTRRKHKRDKNPGAPKHPLSAYMWFLTEVRSETRQSYPGSTVGQISKVCADRWHAMAEVDRLPYQTMASTDKARYAREMRVYASQNNHTMGRGTRQKYCASSPTLLLTSAAALPEQQQHHHHDLFYAPDITTNTSGTSSAATAAATTSSTHTLVSTSVDRPSPSSSSSSFQSSTSILRNSLPGNVAMQDTMNPSELLQSSSSMASSSHLHHHHRHHHHHHTESY